MSLAAIASYTAGQCTAYVASMLGWVPPLLGDAKDWLPNAQKQGYPVSGRPVIGSVAVWGANAGGARDAGHVAVVTGIQGNGLPIVSEMNWTYGPGRADTRAVSTSSAQGIIGYILPRGTASPSTPPNAVPVSTGGVQTAPVDYGWWDPRGWPIIGGAISTGQALVGFFGVLTHPSTWFTLGWFIVGAMLVWQGVRLLSNGAVGERTGSFASASKVAVAA